MPFSGELRQCKETSGALQQQGSGTHCHCGDPAPKGCSVDVWIKWTGPWLKEYLHAQRRAT